MADQLPSPAELRTQARHHREKALRVPDQKTRNMHLTVAAEFEKLAAAVEAELAADVRKRPA